MRKKKPKQPPYLKIRRKSEGDRGATDNALK